MHIFMPQKITSCNIMISMQLQLQEVMNINFIMF